MTQNVLDRMQSERQFTEPDGLAAIARRQVADTRSAANAAEQSSAAELQGRRLKRAVAAQALGLIKTGGERTVDFILR